MRTNSPKFSEWLAAERQAHAAERDLHAIVMRLDTGAQELADNLEHTRNAREAAHALFEPAMQELKSLAASLHYSEIRRGADACSSLARGGRFDIQQGDPSARP